MSINKQCKLLSVPRSSYYYKPKCKVSLEDELLMLAIDRIYLEGPTYGSRRILDDLRLLGYQLGRERVRRMMWIEPIYPKPRLSTPGRNLQSQLAQFSEQNARIPHVDSPEQKHSERSWHWTERKPNCTRACIPVRGRGKKSHGFDYLRLNHLKSCSSLQCCIASSTQHKQIKST